MPKALTLPQTRKGVKRTGFKISIYCDHICAIARHQAHSMRHRQLREDSMLNLPSSPQQPQLTAKTSKVSSLYAPVADKPNIN